jgi:branched-chain amino acid transport system substrate-binding protein
MTRKTNTLFALIAAAALAAAAGSAVAQPAEIVIGAPNAMTGSFGEAGRRVVSGLQVAVDQINREGGIKAIGGAKLKVVPVDTSDNPTQAASVTQRLLSESGAKILVGANTSAMTLSVQIEAERAQVPLLTTSYADPIVQRGLKYTFKLPPQGSSLAELQMAYIIAMTKDIKGQTPKKIAVFAGSDSASQSVLKATGNLAKKYGLDIVSSISFQSGLTDPTQIVSAALQTRPDVVFLSSFTSDVILVTRALRAVNIMVPIITGGGGVSGDTIGATLGKSSENLMGIVCWNWDLPIDGVKQVLDGYKALEPNAPWPPASETLGTGYSIGMVIRAALEKAGTDDPKKVRDAIASLEVFVPMPGGKIAFDERGQNKFIEPILVAWIDGQLRTVWPKQVQAAKPKL